MSRTDVWDEMDVLEDEYPTTTTATVTYNILFAPEVKDLIDAHWYLFPPPSYAWHVTLAGIILVLGVISIAGNGAVIYIFGTTRSLRNPSNALIVNLALSDLCMMAVCCPMYVMSSLQGKWIFGREACRFYGFGGALFGTVSILTIAAIAVDRYLVICKPFLIMKSTMTRERAKFGVAFVWIYSLCWAIPPLFGCSNYVLEGFLTTCSFDYLDPSLESRIFIFAMCIGAFAAPLALIIICYLLIILEVYMHSKKFKKAASDLKGKGPAHKENEENSKKKKEIQTAKIACIITVCWVLAWTPYTIVAVMGISFERTWLTPIVSQLPALFAKTAAVYNPLVYAISHPKYREALKKTFPFLICIKSPEEKAKQPHSSGTGAARSNLPNNPLGHPQISRLVSRSSMADSAISEIEELDNEQIEEGAEDPAEKIDRSPGRKSSLKQRPVKTVTQQKVLKEMVATYSKFPQPEVKLDAAGTSIQLRERMSSPTNSAQPVGLTTILSSERDAGQDGEQLWQEKVTSV